MEASGRVAHSRYRQAWGTRSFDEQRAVAVRSKRRRLNAATLCTVLLTCIAPRPAASAPPPVEAFGRIPQITEVELSPNGKLVAWADNSAATQRVVVVNLEARKVMRTLEVDPTMKLRWITWADEETILVDLSRTHALLDRETSRYEFFRTIAADISGGPPRMLLLGQGDRQFSTGAELLAWRTPKPKTVVMWTYDYSVAADRPEIGTRLSGRRQNSGWVAMLFEVDTRTGNGRLVESGTQYTDEWVLDRNGRAVARSEWDPQRQLFRVLARSNDAWREIHRQEDGEVLTLYGLTADGNAVVALGANGQPLAKVWAIAVDGSGAKVLLEDSTYDVASVETDRYTGAPVAARLGGPESAVRWFDSRAEAQHRSLSSAFPRRNIDVVSRSEDAQRVIARVESPSHPTTYYLVNFSTGTADVVGEAYPALAGLTLGEVQVITYSARDGTALPAYITLPPGIPAEDLPLVVLPHGGPESRDRLEFDWLVQFLASRGYAVLQPQFRGSTGFGEQHRKAGYRQWGGVMQDDVTDGVKSLIARGIADPNRICIVGGSYGGYAALAGAAFTPELYACAASVNGVSDLPHMLGYEERRGGDDSDAMAYWRDHIGSPLDPSVIAKSPVNGAANVRAPVLLLHGVEDTVVPLSQSRAMEKALKQFRKPVTLIQLPGEDHWLSRSETRIRVLKELETFLAAHL